MLILIEGEPLKNVLDFIWWAQLVFKNKMVDSDL